MGSKFEVHVWVKNDKRVMENPFVWKEVYAGELFEDALFVMMKEKNDGAKCVKLYYRG